MATRKPPKRARVSNTIAKAGPAANAIPDIVQLAIVKLIQTIPTNWSGSGYYEGLAASEQEALFRLVTAGMAECMLDIVVNGRRRVLFQVCGDDWMQASVDLAVDESAEVRCVARAVIGKSIYKFRLTSLGEEARNFIGKGLSDKVIDLVEQSNHPYTCQPIDFETEQRRQAETQTAIANSRNDTENKTDLSNPIVNRKRLSDIATAVESVLDDLMNQLEWLADLGVSCDPDAEEALDDPTCCTRAVMAFLDAHGAIKSGDDKIATLLDLSSKAISQLKHVLRPASPVTVPIPASSYSEAALELVSQMRKEASGIIREGEEPSGRDATKVWTFWDRRLSSWIANCKKIREGNVISELKSRYKIELTTATRLLSGSIASLVDSSGDSTKIQSESTKTSNAKFEEDPPGWQLPPDKLQEANPLIEFARIARKCHSFVVSQEIDFRPMSPEKAQANQARRDAVDALQLEVANADRDAVGMPVPEERLVVIRPAIRQVRDSCDRILALIDRRQECISAFRVEEQLDPSDAILTNAEIAESRANEMWQSICQPELANAKQAIVELERLGSENFPIATASGEMRSQLMAPGKSSGTRAQTRGEMPRKYVDALERQQFKVFEFLWCHLDSVEIETLSQNCWREQVAIDSVRKTVRRIVRTLCEKGITNISLQWSDTKDAVRLTVDEPPESGRQ